MCVCVSFNIRAQLTVYGEWSIEGALICNCPYCMVIDGNEVVINSLGPISIQLKEN